jgi:hypothetical protein
MFKRLGERVDFTTLSLLLLTKTLLFLVDLAPF